MGSTKLPQLKPLQFLVLGLLRPGEQPGRVVRDALRTHGVRRTAPAFYQLMARLERDGLIDNARRVGDYLARGARALGVRRVSGRGLLLGLHLGRPAGEIQRALFAHRILTGTASDLQVLRLLPPLSFSLREADLLLTGLREVLG